MPFSLRSSSLRTSVAPAVHWHAAARSPRRPGPQDPRRHELLRGRFRAVCLFLCQAVRFGRRPVSTESSFHFFGTAAGVSARAGGRPSSSFGRFSFTNVRKVEACEPPVAARGARRSTARAGDGGRSPPCIFATNFIILLSIDVVSPDACRALFTSMSKASKP